MSHTATTIYSPSPKPAEGLRSWLKGERTVNGRYSHHRLRQQQVDREAIIQELRDMVDHACEDVRRKLRKAFDNSLDPFGTPLRRDPAHGYPEYLDYITRKGYFGELLSGYIALTFGANGVETWEIPAFLFRFHEAAFQYLARQQQSYTNGEVNLDEIDEKPRIPGRTGDDCLAFFRNTEGRITKALFCEAKFSQSHKEEYIEEAYKKASEPFLIPTDLRQLLEILKDYDDPASQAWSKSLWDLYFSELSDDYERCDLICYIYGQPARNDASRLPIASPHRNYTASRRLEAVELHIKDVRAFVNTVYRG